MSKSTLALSLSAAVAVAISAAVPAYAASPSAAPGAAINYLGVARDYSAWSLSGYAGTFNKNYKDGPGDGYDFTRFNAAVGFNATRWLTFYGIAGVQNQKMKTPFGDTDDSSGVFGLGVWANFIEIDQLSLFESVDRYTLSAGVEGTFADNDFGSYASVDGFLFFEVQGDVGRFSGIFPDTIGIYFGPVVSYSVSSDFDSNSSDIVGFGVGVNVKFTDNISLKVGGDFYSNDNAAYAQFGINF